MVKLYDNRVIAGEHNAKPKRGRQSQDLASECHVEHARQPEQRGRQHEYRVDAQKLRHKAFVQDLLHRRAVTRGYRPDGTLHGTGLWRYHVPMFVQGGVGV